MDGCEQPSRKRGWCASHYAQQRATGRPPEPFKYKWAAERRCEVCGIEHASPGKRRHCSQACQQRAARGRRNPASVLTDTNCALCGDAIQLMTAGSTRKKSCETRMCDSCRRSRTHRHGFAVKVLRNRDGSRCGICGEIVDFDIAHPNPASPSVDHVIPRAHGGSDDPSNLQLAHLGCNQRKHARLPEEMAAHGL